jgi:hypothetical protein
MDLNVFKLSIGQNTLAVKHYFERVQKWLAGNGLSPGNSLALGHFPEVVPAPS